MKMENGHEEPINTTNFLNSQIDALKATCTKEKADLYVLYRVVDEFNFEKNASSKPSKEK